MHTGKLDAILTSGQSRLRTEQALLHRDWLVYGAGRAGRSWASALAAHGMTVHAFLDRNPKTGGPLPMHVPADCPPHLRDQSAVLLALHNPGANVAQVRSELHALGFTHIFLLQDLVDAFPQQAHFWLAPVSETLPCTDAIRAGYALLEDAQSRHLYLALLDQRLNGNVDGLPPPEPGTQYLPQGVPLPTTPLRLIDCGAYRGDTIDSFLRAGLAYEALAAFEPDPTHFPALCATAATLPACVFPCGVWQDMRQLRFTSDDAASHVDTLGETVVQTVALDQALPSFAPNMIKMDIEGAEAQALQGAQCMIACHRPHLAISVYHRPRDLWEIMQQIQGWVLNYRFRLRCHAYNGFDTVLYAEPA